MVAATRNRYRVPTVNPVNVTGLAGSVPHVDHELPLFDDQSIVYEVMVAPPSSTGAVQVRTICEL